MKNTLLHRKIIRPIWRYAYQIGSSENYRRKTFPVQISKLLRGGHNGIRAAKYAELTGNFLLPSTSIFEGAHVKLLQLYNQIGDEIFNDEILKDTDYYKEAVNCMRLTGSYFYDRPEQIKVLIERFIKQHKGEKINYPVQPGQSAPDYPVFVRQIRYSSFYEVIDGNHRIARAIMKGDESIPVFIYEKEPALTPLQQLLLDCLWINKQKWLYQPVDKPELKDEWKLVRACSDRFGMMKLFLDRQELLGHKQKKKTYIDVGSSYGWFVSKMGELGFNACGIERDPFGMEIGFRVYGLQKQQIIHSDIILGLEGQVKKRNIYDVVSCLSVLHHFALGKSSTSTENLIRLLDQITGKVLFLDTGEEHESAFGQDLKGWNPAYISRWIKENSTFSDIIPLGLDQDRVQPFENYYNRTLFACIK